MVEQRQQSCPTVDDGDLDAERGEDRGVLGTDRAASDYQDPLGEPVDREHRLGVVVARDRRRRASWLGAAFDYRDPIAVVGGPTGPLLSGGSGADHDEVEAVGIAMSRDPGHGYHSPSCAIG
jgi:hypothetical protein